MQKETELTYAGLKNMKKNDFAKSFKKSAPWKKAKGVLFLAKYKFANGKMPLVAIPFKKYNEAAKCFKTEVKKDSIYSAKLTLLASLEKKQDDNGNLVFKITPTQSSMNTDFLDTYGKELFGKLKTGFEVIGTEGKLDNEDIQEVVKAADETLSTLKTNKLVAKRQKRAEKATKVQENLGKFEKAIGKVEAPKLQEKLSLYQQVLSNLTAEAQEDGEIDADEQKELDRMQQNIERMEQLTEDVEEAKSIAKIMKEIIIEINQEQ
jgi:hypothetical protein